MVRLILKILLILLQLVVKHYVLLELVLIVTEQWMFHDIGKTHSLLTVDNKNTLKEVLQLGMGLLQPVLFAESSYQTEMRVRTTTLNLSLHVVT